MDLDRHIRNVMRSAPDFVHHLYALHGANEALANLKDEKGNAAHLIWLTSSIVCTISETFHPIKLFNAPSDIHFHADQAKHFFEISTREIISSRLALLEDLFYAVIAKLKEFLQQADTLLENGFKGPDDLHVIFTSGPLAQINGLRLGEFRACVLIQQDLLLGESMTRLMDDALLLTNFRGQEVEPTSIAPDMHKQHFRCSRSRRMKCLQDVTRMSSGMLFAYLTEKYHASGHGVCASPMQAIVSPINGYHEYFSPYDLTERGKKISNSSPPEMPCICDPGCVCAPLCASEPKGNCLCEENGLFVRVTEGMDIDDLAVPDLIRRRRSISETSTTTTQSDGCLRHKESVPIDVQDVRLCDIESELEQQQQEQTALYKSFFGPQGIEGVASFDFHDSVSKVVSTDSATVSSRKVQPGNTISALDPTWRLPFARQCPTPPKEGRRRPAVKRVLGGENISRPRKRFQPRFVLAPGVSESL